MPLGGEGWTCEGRPLGWGRKARLRGSGPDFAASARASQDACPAGYSGQAFEDPFEGLVEAVRRLEVRDVPGAGISSSTASGRTSSTRSAVWAGITRSSVPQISPGGSRSASAISAQVGGRSRAEGGRERRAPAEARQHEPGVVGSSAEPSATVPASSAPARAADRPPGADPPLRRAVSNGPTRAPAASWQRVGDRAGSRPGAQSTRRSTSSGRRGGERRARRRRRARSRRGRTGGSSSPASAIAISAATSSIVQPGRGRGRFAEARAGRRRRTVRPRSSVPDRPRTRSSGWCRRRGSGPSAAAVAGAGDRDGGGGDLVHVGTLDPRFPCRKTPPTRAPARAQGSGELPPEARSAASTQLVAEVGVGDARQLECRAGGSSCPAARRPRTR